MRRPRRDAHTSSLMRTIPTQYASLMLYWTSDSHTHRQTQTYSECCTSVDWIETDIFDLKVFSTARPTGEAINRNVRVVQTTRLPLFSRDHFPGLFQDIFSDRVRAMH